MQRIHKLAGYERDASNWSALAAGTTQGGPCHEPTEGRTAKSKVATHSRDPHTCHAWIEVSSGIDRPTEFRHTPAHPVQTRISPKSRTAKTLAGVPDGLKWKAQTKIRIISAGCLGYRDSKRTATDGSALVEQWGQVGTARASKPRGA